MEGYSALLMEGLGIKVISISFLFEREEEAQEFFGQIDENVFKKYRIVNRVLSRDGAFFVFSDKPGTMRFIPRFLEFFLPLLKRSAALGIEYCPHCKRRIDGPDTWKLAGGSVYRYHVECAEAAMQEFIEKAETSDEEKHNGLKIRDLTL